MKNALIVFIRNPEKGKVKSRLAKDFGEDKTLAVYEYLLQYTRDLCSDGDFSSYVFYSDYINDNDIWNGTCFAKHLQEGDDLGQKMKNAFAKVFGLGFEKVSIIGSDCYELTANHIKDAFIHLEKHDVVIGPSKDGGYYLLGMKLIHPELFAHKNWGSNDVLISTLDDLEHLKLKFSKLPSLNDIDTIEDLSGTDILEKCNLDLFK